MVSVIIPCWNSERFIISCLHSVLTQKTTILFEVIVVDSSTDQTPYLIQKQFPSVKLIHLDTQTYPGAGRNIGAEHAKGKILAFLDSDCVASEDWLEKAVSALKQGYSIVGGGVGNANPGVISWPDYFLAFNEFLPTMPQREVQFMPTCNFIITADAFNNIGGFRGDLFAAEDTLFCCAAREKYKLLFDPSILLKHTNRIKFHQFMNHHYTFGKHSAYVRKQTNLPGKVFVRYPLLVLGVIFARGGMITRRMLWYNSRYWGWYLVTSPLLLLGLTAWSWGFMKEAFRK